MAVSSPLYMGFDLSTQQLKGIVVSSDLKVQHQAVFDFDTDSEGFDVNKGVLTNEEEREVYAPVALWLQAIGTSPIGTPRRSLYTFALKPVSRDCKLILLICNTDAEYSPDAVLQKLKDQEIDFAKVKAISGAGMQHGSIYWNEKGERALENLRSDESLEHQLSQAFSFGFSPNWQDSSTQEQCDLFDKYLGDEKALASKTGSKAHHRFTGPQILRFRMKHPQEYQNTSRISLVSSFLASIFLGRIAPIDMSDVCGMNLWDIENGKYNEELMSLAAGSPDIKDLESKLGEVAHDGGSSMGSISAYFAERYGFNPSCSVTPFTGDNPSTILALPLRPFDAIVSLGTSTTFLMSTHHYKPDPAVHFFNHPTTSGLYMFMLCYKNGGLAREQIRDSQGPPGSRDPWSLFNHRVTHSPPLGAFTPSSSLKIALYFPRPEIVPNVGAGVYRYNYNAEHHRLSSPGEWNLPDDDARAIVESQLLSLRLRSRNIIAAPSPNPHNLPAQPRRVYLVGGGSQNQAIAKLAGQILGGVEGVYRLDVGGNACALGSAYKAVWAAERRPEETFEEFIEGRWREEEFVERVAEGYQAKLYEDYGRGVEALDAAEKEILKEAKEVQKAGVSGAGQIV